MDPVSPPLSSPSENTPRSRFSFPKIPLGLKLLLTIIVIAGIAFFSLTKLLPLFHKTTRTTTEKFALTESYPTDQSSQISLVTQPTFVFSKKLGIAEKDLPTYFHISPKVEGTWHIEKNQQVVYFATNKKSQTTFPKTFTYDSIYTISIDKALTAQNGEKLPATKTVTFRTKRNPQFTLYSEWKLLSLFASKPVSLPIINNAYDFSGNPLPPETAPVKITVFAATVDQFLSYFQFTDGNNPLYIPPSTQTMKTVLVTNAIQKQDTLGRQAYDIGQLKAGLYYVTIENTYGKEDLFITVSNHIHQVLFDKDSTTIWATDTEKGTHLSNVSVSTYGVKNTIRSLESETTDKNGLVTFSKKIEDTDFVVTKSGSDTAITKTYSYDKATENNFTTFSYTDRPVYRPGDTVHYKAFIVKQDSDSLLPSVNKDFYIGLTTNFKELDESNATKVIPDSVGSVTSDLVLPKEGADLYPQIVLAQKIDGKMHAVDTLDLSVQSYRKPDMQISVSLDKKEYISKDTAQAVITAKTLYGKPLANIPFSYRVLSNDMPEVRDRADETPVDTTSYGDGKELTTGQATFDAKGKASITFSTDLNPKGLEVSQSLTFEILPQIAASPSVAKEARLTHRGEFALFLKDVTQKDKNSIDGKIEVLDHAATRKPFALTTPLSVEIYKIVNYSTKNLVDTQTASESSDTAAFHFTNLDEGDYEIIAKAADARGNTVTSDHVTEHVGILTTTSSETTYSMSLTSDKKRYAPGETALVTLQSDFPLADVLLTTATSNGAQAYYSRNGTGVHLLSITESPVNTSEITFSIPINKTQIQPVQVEIFTAYKQKVLHSYVSLLINNDDKKLMTSLQFDKQSALPGSTITATITTKDAQNNPVSADTSLSLIDSAVTQIASVNQNIFDTIYSPVTSFLASYDSTMGIYTGGGGGGGCFLTGTQILMSDGTTKSIENVHVGDKILTRSSDTSNTLVADTVEKTFHHIVDDYITINNTLRVTPIHRIFLNNTWHIAQDARIGDTLLTSTGEIVPITSLRYNSGSYSVYNLTTSVHHTFIAEGFYVHNDKGGPTRQNFVDTAYWNPHIHTDNQGKATVKIKLPDNLTTYSAQVFAATTSVHYGQAVASVVAEKPYSLIPTLPNFFYAGDKPLLSLLFQNSSGKDFTGEIQLSSKQTPSPVSIPTTVKDGDTEEVVFPATIPSAPSLSYQFDAYEKDTKTPVDSLLVKRPILPKGNLVASWMSYSGEKGVTIQTPYPLHDGNIVSLSIIPHIGLTLPKKTYYPTTEPSTTTGAQIYAWSYILGKTASGALSPTAYKYALTRNELRDTIEEMLENTSVAADKTHWTKRYGYQIESDYEITGWLSLGLQEALTSGLMADISQKDHILQQAYAYLQTNDSQVFDETLIRDWVLKKTTPALMSNPEYIAMKAASGSTQSLSKIKEQKLLSADDRYLWDGGLSGFMQPLSTLALVRYGSSADAEKAIKGLSITDSINEKADALTLRAGIEDMVKRGLSLSTDDSYQLMANDTVLFDSADNLHFYNSTITLPIPKESGSVKIKTTSSTALPVYTTITSTIYTDESEKQRGFNFFSDGITREKVLPDTLTRSIRDMGLTKDLTDVKVGEPAIHLLTAKPTFFSNRYITTPQNVFSYMLVDSISPGVMYLDQTSGNSPQYQSVLSNLFKGPDQYSPLYISPVDSTDTAVYYSGTPSKDLRELVLPYVAFTISDGTYYQPKTSFVFTNLGLMLKEK